MRRESAELYEDSPDLYNLTAESLQSPFQSSYKCVEGTKGEKTTTEFWLVAAEFMHIQDPAPERLQSFRREL